MKENSSAILKVSQVAKLVKLKRQLESCQKQLQEEKEAFEKWSKKERVEINDLKNKTFEELETTSIIKSEVESQIIAIRDFIHEQKKFNERMNASVDQLKYASNTLKDKPYDSQAQNLILNVSKSIGALSRLSSMRMEMLEFYIAPDVFSKMTPKRFNIWKEFEKIHKSINNGTDTTRDKFIMEGGSVGNFQTKRILTIAIFIILENAWKYSPKDDSVKIKINEDSDNIEVWVKNMGPSVSQDEIPKLTQRSYRGFNAKITPGVDGKGLGLNIAKDIFNMCGVEFYIDVSESPKRILNKIEYAPFTIHLVFPLR